MLAGMFNIPVVVVLAVIVVVAVVVVVFTDVARTLLRLLLLHPGKLLRATTCSSNLNNGPVLLHRSPAKEAGQHRVAPLHLVASTPQQERLISVHTSPTDTVTVPD